MKDRDIVKRFFKIVKVGHIRVQKFKNRKWSPSFRWRTKCKAHVNYILTLFLPYFGKRRTKKAKEVLKIVFIRGEMATRIEDIIEIPEKPANVDFTQEQWSEIMTSIWIQWWRLYYRTHRDDIDQSLQSFTEKVFSKLGEYVNALEAAERNQNAGTEQNSTSQPSQGS